MARFIEADVIQKIATEAEWLTQTRIPYQGQIMIVSDSAGKVTNIKVGDGVNPFADLNYMFDSIQQNAQYVPITSNALPTPVADPAWGMVTGGTYTFGGVDVFTVPDGHWGIANYSSGVWSLVDMGDLPQVQGVDEINPIGENIPKEKAVARYAPSKTSVGILQYNEGVNILQFLTDSDIDDPIWLNDMFVSKNSGNVSASPSSKVTDFIEIHYPGDIDFNYRFVLFGNAGVCFYDENKVFIRSIGTTSPTTDVVEGVITITPDIRYIRVSHHATSNTSHILFETADDTEIVTSDVFLRKEDREDIEDESAIKAEELVLAKTPLLNEVGVQNIDIGDNMILQITESSFDDESIWREGYLNKDDGKPREGSLYKYTRKFATKGGIPFEYSFYLLGDAGVCFYDENEAFISSISNSTPEYEFTGSGVTPVNAKFISVTQYTTRPPVWSSMIAQQGYRISTDSVYLPTFRFDEASKANEVGIDIIEVGDNGIKDITNSQFTDTNIWSDGFLHKDDGTPRSSSSYKYTKQFPIKGGVTFDCEFYMIGNAGICFYDSDGNFISSISNTSGSYTLTGQYTSPVNAATVAVSQYTTRNPSASKMLATSRYRMVTSRVFQLAGEGGKEILKETLKIYSKIKPVRPVVSFISDDGHVNNGWYLDLLDSFDIKSTFAIITGRFGDDYPDYYNKAQVKDLLLDGGHEIAGHTVDHDTNNRLDTLDESELNNQIGSCYMDLKQLDNRIRPTNFVSPWGRRNSLVDKVVNQYFDHNYTTVSSALLPNGDVINKPPIDSLVMKRVSFDTPSGNQGQSNIDVLKEVVDRLELEGGWIVFAIHPQYAEYQLSNSVDRRGELQELIQYILDKKIPILTASQASDYYNNTKIGDRRVDSKYYEIGIDGSTIGDLL